MSQLVQRTGEEVRKLKAEWLQDPCWDIEETEGFEAHKAELLAYRNQQEAEWKQQRDDKAAERARELMCSVPLADYIIRLEYRLSAMAEQLQKMEKSA